MRILSVRHNSFATKSYPWADRLVSGLERAVPCAVCGTAQLVARGPISLTLERNKGNLWPDVLGCGAYPLLIVSKRVLEFWSQEQIGVFPTYPVEILLPFPRKLSQADAPSYFWLDGSAMRGALLDFDASGFVGVRFCPACGNRTHEIAATSQRRRSQTFPYALRPGTWAGATVFTTDLSPTTFFCTGAVLDVAIRHRLTNFRFVDADHGDAPASKGIKYLT
jgi:hypothetical protein